MASQNDTILQQLNERVECQSAILAASAKIDEVLFFIAHHDEEEVEAELISMLGTTRIGASAVLDCQFRRLTPKNRAKISQDLALLKSEIHRLSD